MVLMSEAAHRIHPIAGQGLNVGLRDVATLADVLAEQRSLGLDVGAREATIAYERRRRFDAATLGAATDGLNRLFSNASPILAKARGLGLAGVERVPPLKRFFMREAGGAVGSLPALLRGEWPKGV
jgi:2-octaprenyl-6-methoxyphenol hydroxylase